MVPGALHPNYGSYILYLRFGTNVIGVDFLASLAITNVTFPINTLLCNQTDRK